MFWIIVAALTLLVALAILRPFLRRAAPVAEPASAYDLRVYRDQLAETERDLARGVISADEAERLRIEIGRKVLEADRALGRETAELPVARRAGLAAPLLMGLAALGAVAMYLWLGSPGMPDMARAARIADAEARYASRPSQEEAEKAATPMPPPPVDPEYTQLIEQLRAALEERPDDIQGLTLLARSEARLGNIDRAMTAQTRLMALRGDDVTGADHAMLAGLMIESAGGLITPEAEAHIASALRLDPQNGEARYMAGLLQAQNGRPDRAFPIWAELLESSPPDAPWNDAIRPVITEFAWLAGEPSYTPPEPTASAPMAGPDADALAAAQEMTPEERQEMIRGMVERLEDRLGTSGGTPPEWARLITSLVQIGQSEHAAEIYAEAQARFADAPEQLAIIREAAQQAGLE